MTGVLTNTLCMHMDITLAVFIRMTRNPRALFESHTWQLVIIIYNAYHNVICVWYRKVSRSSPTHADEETQTIGVYSRVGGDEKGGRRKETNGGWSPTKGGFRQGWRSVRPDIRYLRVVLIRSSGSVARECRNILLLHACACDIYIQ